MIGIGFFKLGVNVNLIIGEKEVLIFVFEVKIEVIFL